MPESKTITEQERDWWVDFTPEEVIYSIDMYDHYRGSLQEIDLTRDEFIGLKAALAAMRQIQLAETEAKANA